MTIKPTKNRPPNFVGTSYIGKFILFRGTCIHHFYIYNNLMQCTNKFIDDKICVYDFQPHLRHTCNTHLDLSIQFYPFSAALSTTDTLRRGMVYQVDNIDNSCRNRSLSFATLLLCIISVKRISWLLLHQNQWNEISIAPSISLWEFFLRYLGCNHNPGCHVVDFSE